MAPASNEPRAQHDAAPWSYSVCCHLEMTGSGRWPFANEPIAASVGLIFPFESRSNGGAKPWNRIFCGDFHTPPKNSHFSRLFCDFSLRSAITLAIVAAARVFSVKNRGSQLAACFDRIGVERKIRRISRLDGSQATEQDQGCGTHRRESRHTEENRRSIL